MQKSPWIHYVFQHNALTERNNTLLRSCRETVTLIIVHRVKIHSASAVKCSQCATPEGKTEVHLRGMLTKLWECNFYFPGHVKSNMNKTVKLNTVHSPSCILTVTEADLVTVNPLCTCTGLLLIGLSCDTN